MSSKAPKYALDVYRQFIRDAASYVSIVLGRKLKSADSERFTDEEIRAIALMIDERVKNLPNFNGGEGSGTPGNPKG